MSTLEDKIKFLKIKLKKAISYLDLLTEENFDEVFPKIEKCLKEFENERNALKESETIERLKKFNKEFEVLTKEIQKRFDSRLQDNRFKQKEVVKELNKVVNKKKLANYR